MDPYDIARIFVSMEHDLIASMKRNFARHLAEEEKEGFEWEQWQRRKLQALASYRANNKKLINAAGEIIDREAEVLLQDSFRQGGKNVDKDIEQHWKKPKPYFILERVLTQPITRVDGTDASFFKANEKRLNALIKAVTHDLQKARYAMLRQADDVYRQTIFKSQMYLNTGATSLGQAIDMATNDFLDKGLDCIIYKNGRRVNIASYAEMALRASSQRAVFTGEGARREEWGVRTVVVSSHNNCSPLCLPWQGKVYIDDVYSGGKKGQGNYPLLSTAMRGGLFHPHCRHNTGTYFEGISSLPEPVDDEKALANYDVEQKQRYMERQVRKYKRHEAGSVDPHNQKDAAAKVRYWQGKIREHLTENTQLRRDPRREKIKGGLTPTERNAVLKKAAIEKAVNIDILSNREWLKSSFSTQKKFDKHLKDHLGDYGNTTPEQYLNLARGLLSEQLSKDVEGFVDKDGFVFKYKNSSNDFAIGRPDGKISTLYKPTRKKGYWIEQIEKFKVE
jgi:hypothetical protein